MRRAIGFALLGVELAIVSWWFLNIRFETGIDALLYHRMAHAIVANGLAPWVINPLSYIGMYPGSDSSGVPFLAASFAILSGTSVGETALAYDAVLLLLFGLGLFLLAKQLTDRADIALLAVLLGSLAYGFFSTLSWNLDERSLNVAIAPLFLVFILPPGSRTSMRAPAHRKFILGIVSFVMFVSHLSFLLLLPFLVLLPLFHEIFRRARTIRRKKRSSLAYFGAIGLFPLVLLFVLNQVGALNNLGLENQLESSALFSGSSPAIFLLNAIVFLGTRVGPVSLGCVLLGIVYLASRPYLASRNVTIGGFLLCGFIGLPVVLYSKDLLTPVLTVIAAIGLVTIVKGSGRRRTQALIVCVTLVIGGSVSYDLWNAARTSKLASLVYWSPPGLTPEVQSGNLWIGANEQSAGCVYGNNAVALQQLSTGARLLVCMGIPVDFLINKGSVSAAGQASLRVIYVGFSNINPSNWFISPDLTTVSSDFASLANLGYPQARLLLVHYNVSLVIVDMQKPTQVPLYAFQGTQPSPFFEGLWNNMYPMYLSENFAVFRID